MTISTPITNARQYYINGLILHNIDTTHVQVTAGRCSDSTNTNDISVGLPLNVAATQTGTEPVDAGTGAVTIFTGTNGAGGIDTGTVQENTFYSVYAIGDSYGLNPGSALVSASQIAPLLPIGYDMFFRIGFVKTDGTGSILAFDQSGSGLDRWMQYDSYIATSVTAGGAGQIPIDASASIPPNVTTPVRWVCSFAPIAAGNNFVLAPGAHVSSTGYAQSSGSVATVAQVVDLLCPNDLPLTQAAVYTSQSTAVAVSVAAYLDQLGLNPVA